MKHSKHIVERLGKPLLQAKLSPFPLENPIQVDRKLSRSGMKSKRNVIQGFDPVSRLKRGGK
jgi:hypothetical protein